MRFRRRHGGAAPIPTDTSCDLLDYRSIFQARPPALPLVPPGTAPPTLDPYSRDDWRGTALLSDDYVFVVITLLPDANDHTQRNVLARLLGDSEDTPPTAPPGDVDDTSRCTLFPLQMWNFSFRDQRLRPWSSSAKHQKNKKLKRQEL